VLSLLEHFTYCTTISADNAIVKVNYYSNVGVDPVEVVGDPGVDTGEAGGGATVTVGHHTHHSPPSSRASVHFYTSFREKKKHSIPLGEGRTKINGMVI
jgi:hypothetical protein